MGSTTDVISSFIKSRGECEEKTIVVQINNVQELLKMSNKELDEMGVIFEVGDCTLNDGTQIPATWKYSFEHSNDASATDVVWFGGFLVLHRSTNKSDVKSAKASYSVSLSCGGFCKSVEAEQKEFAGTSGCGRANKALIRELSLLHYTQGTNTLEATLVTKVFSSHSFNPVLKIPPSIPPVQLKGQINSDLIKMLESGDWSDVEIRVPKEVGGEVVASSYTRKAHKNILTARSSVFAKMFAQDSTMIEAQTGKVTIKDLSPKGLDIFLRFLYTGEVLQGWVHVGTEIFNVADKYDCDDLKQYCRLNILDAVSTSNALELYKSAKLHGLADAAKKVVDFISKNTEAIMDQVFEESK